MGNQMAEQIDIKSFWNHLTPLLLEINISPENNELIHRIDNFISEEAEFDWEYGPSSTADFYFCLSPNLREELIDDVERMIALAPSIDGWEFIAGKPRKDEIVPWIMLGENDEEIEVDPSEWRFILYKFKDNTFDIDVKLDGLNGSQDFQYLVVNIFLTSALGEKEFMRLIKNINIVEEFYGGSNAKSIPMIEIYKVISKHIV